jgi:hypothetical protein
MHLFAMEFKKKHMTPATYLRFLLRPRTSPIILGSLQALSQPCLDCLPSFFPSSHQAFLPTVSTSRSI